MVSHLIFILMVKIIELEAYHNFITMVYLVSLKEENILVLSNSHMLSPGTAQIITLNNY